MKKLAVVIAVFVLMGATFALAHPHFNKSISVKLPGGIDATVSYQTVPSNEMHAQQARVGSFITPRGPRLTLSAELKAGAATIPAGEYTIGAIKNGDKDWTLALYPGRVGREAPDMSKMIKLDSMFTTAHGAAEHMTVDITPGHGKHEGKAVLILHFGTLYLAGALS